MLICIVCFSSSNNNSSNNHTNNHNNSSNNNNNNNNNNDNNNNNNKFNVSCNAYYWRRLVLPVYLYAFIYKQKCLINCY